MTVFYNIFLLLFVVLFCLPPVEAMDHPFDVQNFQPPKLEAGVYSKQGTRYGQITNGKEDRIEDRSVIENLSHYFKPEKQVVTDTFFGVYDGHGGCRVAEYLAGNLHKLIGKRLTENKVMEEVEQAIYASFSAADKQVDQFQKQGSTAIVALLLDDTLWIANTGDSRAVIFKKEGDSRKIWFTRDHKPDDSDERARIEAEGGTIFFYNGAWRVGRLSLSRAIGDYPKEPGLSAIPDVEAFALNAFYQFMILASDGIWDVISNEEAVRQVQNVFRVGGNAQKAAEALVKKALEKRSRDDLTAMVVRFRW
jgi:protein phosphatase 1L